MYIYTTLKDPKTNHEHQVITEHRSYDSAMRRAETIEAWCQQYRAGVYSDGAAALHGLREALIPGDEKNGEVQ